MLSRLTRLARTAYMREGNWLVPAKKVTLKVVRTRVPTSAQMVLDAARAADAFAVLDLPVGAPAPEPTPIRHAWHEDVQIIVETINQGKSEQRVAGNALPWKDARKLGRAHLLKMGWKPEGGKKPRKIRMRKQSGEWWRGQLADIVERRGPRISRSAERRARRLDRAQKIGAAP